MHLVDTSVWIDHLRKSDSALTILLESAQAVTHPFIIGEIALGSLRNRDAVLAELARLPLVRVALDGEVRQFIEQHRLFGSGLGYIDAHLLVSARLEDAALFSRDRRLAGIAERLGLSPAQATSPRQR